jgi:hypothetical protein
MSRLLVNSAMTAGVTPPLVGVWCTRSRLAVGLTEYGPTVAEYCACGLERCREHEEDYAAKDDAVAELGGMLVIQGEDREDQSHRAWGRSR